MGRIAIVTPDTTAMLIVPLLPGGYPPLLKNAILGKHLICLAVDMPLGHHDQQKRLLQDCEAIIALLRLKNARRNPVL